MPRTVSEIAALAGVTVRTLHHYDTIGLLRPATRTDAGYRLYDDAGVTRLHEIVVWRSLGFPLDEIRALLDDPAHDPLEALRLHRARLQAELGELHDRLTALDRAIARAEQARPFDDDDLVALFDGFDARTFADEAEQTWGHTDAFREAQRRTAGYGPAEWRALKAEADAIHEELARLRHEGLAPDAPEVRVAAEAHRAHIEHWFYPCPAEIHRGLGQLYTTDPRFTATYDRIAEGLATYLSDAIEALHAPRSRRL